MITITIMNTTMINKYDYNCDYNYEGLYRIYRPFGLVIRHSGRQVIIRVLLWVMGVVIHKMRKLKRSSDDT